MEFAFLAIFAELLEILIITLWKGSHKLAQVISKRDMNVILITFPHPPICSSVNITYSGNNYNICSIAPTDNAWYCMDRSVAYQKMGGRVLLRVDA